MIWKYANKPSAINPYPKAYKYYMYQGKTFFKVIFMC